MCGCDKGYKMNLGPRPKTVTNILRVALGLLVILPTAAVAVFSTPRVQNKPKHARLAPLSKLTTINLLDFGAVGDGIADDGPALQSALDALAQAGGGTLYVPPGNYAIVTPVVKQFNSATSIVLQGEPSATPISVAGNGLGLDLTSDFIIKVGPANDAISILGAGDLRVNDLSFTGVQEVTTDAHVVLKLSEVGDARIQHSEFYGLASLVPRGAIVFAFKSSLSIQDTPFLGCATASGHSTSAVQNVRWNAISLINSKFIDYGQRPGFYSKTPLSPAYSWLGIGNAAALEPSNSRRTAIVNNVFLDEGQFFGISAIPDLFDIPSAPFEVYISRLVMNVSNLASVGVYLDEAQKVFIDRSFFGWSHNAGAAIALTCVGEAIFDQLECVAHADTIVADAATQRLTVINSIYANLLSEAPYTVTITTEDPLDDPVQYVRQQYLDLANREPDPVGQFYWADLILRCGSDTECTSQKQSALANYLGTTPAEKFSIAGTIRDENGAPLAGVTVALSGSQSVSTVSDPNGQYSFDNLATAGIYQVTASKRHYMFQSLAFETPGQDQVGDFTGILDRHTISGRVTNSLGQPIAGTLVTLSDPEQQTETTDANGNYSFPDIPAGSDYTVTVSRRNYTFADPDQSFTDLSADMFANFTGSLLSYQIIGKLSANTGGPIVGASVTLSGSQHASALSDSSGRYSFLVPGEGNYTVSVARANYSFTNPSRSFTNLSGDATADFSGTLLHYTLSGHVTNDQSVGIAGVTVTLTGSETGSKTTDSGGNYSFSATAEGNYAITVARANYAFNPASRAFTNLSGDAVADFSGTLVLYTLSGRIVNGTVPLAGVTVNLTGSKTASVLTDADGRYSFVATAEGSYTVTPVTQYYRFTPQNFHHDNLSGNFVDDFIAVRADTVQFSNANFVASPGSSAVEITVTRAGDTSQPASVKYSTSDGTASQTNDYTATSGTLRFLSGESTKTFTVLITVNTYSGADETANLRLTRPSGFLLGDQRLATLIIADQPIPGPVTNPIEDSRTFVFQQYADFLGRLADNGGLDYWTNQITRCETNVSCISSARVATSAAFFAEPEFQQTGGFIYRLFRATLGRRPTYNQFVDQRGQLQSYGDPAAATVLFAHDFVLRSDFLTKYPETLTPQQFVDSLITTTRETTGVDLASQRDSLVADYSTNHDRGRIIRLIADNDLVQRAEYNSAFVLMQYFGYLRRDPDEGGYNFWLDVLNNRQPDNFRGMVCAFVTSREYQERFSSVVPRNDSECGSVH